MVDVTNKDRLQPQETRSFLIGDSSVLAEQNGRLTRISHDNIGTSFLIDVTDQIDPTTIDDHDPNSKGDVVRDLLRKKLVDDRYNDTYAHNNGVVATITEKLDSQGRRRVYIGVYIWDPNKEEVGEITMGLLSKARFRDEASNYYVPYSFDSGLIYQNVRQELETLMRESPNPDLFRPLIQQLALPPQR